MLSVELDVKAYSAERRDMMQNGGLHNARRSFTCEHRLEWLVSIVV
jgi:hypothetical protein